MNLPPLTPRARRWAATRPAGGFTLVELLVSLTAGLVVALGVFGLAKTASNTFQSEQRVASAEMSLRSAVERLRADLQRASFMSTGNIRVDPTVATPTNGVRTIGRAGVDNLAGVRLLQGGSIAATSTYSTLNGLSPDAIDIGGNLTTSDEFVVKTTDQHGGCTRLWLNTDSPAMYRLRGSAGSGSTAAVDGGVAASSAEQDALRALFQPVPLRQANGSADPDASRQFIVRISDGTGKYQFRPTCQELWSAGFDGGQPYVDVQGSLLTGADTSAQGGVSGLASGRIVVNPVQLVRWQIASMADIYAAHGRPMTELSALRETTEPGMFHLVRSWLDAAREYAGPPELVAEYAVDLRFGLTVDDARNQTGASPVLLPLAIGAATNASYAYDLATTNTLYLGPQRVRGVRFRLSTRSAFADREGVVGAAAEGAVYTYCMVPSAASFGECRQLARMRTISTEVNLPNQARMFY